MAGDTQVQARDPLLNAGAPLPTQVRFGPFEVDLRANQPRKHGIRIKLQEKPFQFLALLLERPGEVVTREQLRDQLWPSDTFVDFEGSLNTAANRLRHVLGDSAEFPRFIETIPRKGYRFIYPVAPVNSTVVSAEALHRAGSTGQAESIVGRPTRLWRKFAIPALALSLVALLIVVAVALRFTVQGWKTISQEPGKIMLAVLPFENLSGDPQQEYFSDGLTDEMITQLGRLQPARLGVIARTSAMQYKGRRQNLAHVATELGVDYLLEGSVRRSNGRVRISAQLVQARDQTQLWAESYERETSDVLAIQREVGDRVARSLALELLPAGETARARGSSSNAAAYDAYLRGRYVWNRRTEEGLRRSVEYFGQAIRLDPNYAAAYAGLADSYIVLAAWFYMKPNEAYPKAEAAAVKALEINESLPEAHSSMGVIAWEYHRDRARADKEFQLALQLNPGYATAHQWYAEFLSADGRHEEALAAIHRARELDPLSLIINSVVGYIYYYARRYDEAIVACRKTLELDPDFGPAHLYLSWIYIQKGMHDESAAERRKAMARSSLDNQNEAGYQAAFKAEGITGARRWLVAERIKQSKREYVPPYWIAVLYAGLAEPDKAFEWLEKAYRQNDPSLTRIKVDPKLDPIRSDPRFASLVKSMGLAP